MPLTKEAQAEVDRHYPKNNEDPMVDVVHASARHAAEFGYYLGLANAVDKIAKDAWNAAASYYKSIGGGPSYSEWLKEYKKNY